MLICCLYILYFSCIISLLWKNGREYCMKGPANAKSINVQTLIVNLLTNSSYNNDYGTLCRKLSIDYALGRQKISRLVKEGVLFKDYDLLVSLIEILGGDVSDLDEFKKSDPAFIFIYWNNIYPELCSLKYLGYCLKELCINQKNLSYEQIAKLTSSSTPHVSRIFTCETSVTYNTFSKYCSALEMTELEVLSYYAENNQKYDEIKQNSDFCGYLKELRSSLKLNVTEAASLCMLTVEDYNLIESGNRKLSETEIQNIAFGFKVPSDKLLTLAQNSKLYNKSGNKKYTVRLREGKKNLFTLLGIIDNYQYISVGDSKIESHTFITLVMLILLNKTSNTYITDILYYLNNLREEGNLALKYYNNPEFQDMSCIEILNCQRERLGISYQKVAECAGMAQSSVFHFFKWDSLSYIHNVAAISKVIGMSPMLAFEQMVENDKPDKETASFNDIIATVRDGKVWSFNNDLYSPDTISAIINIILTLDSKYTALAKYDDIIARLNSNNI